MTRRLVILLYSMLWCIAIGAQEQQQSVISGAVIDDETGDSISFASIVYKGHNIATVADAWGKYKIERHEGWNITVSAVGYKTRIIAIIGRTKKHLNIRLKPDNKQLEGVTIKVIIERLLDLGHFRTLLLIGCDAKARQAAGNGCSPQRQSIAR